MAWCDGLKETRLLIAPLPCTLNPEEVNNRNAEGCILSLRHPKSGSATCYVLRHGSIQELHWFKQSYGSWFLGDYVCEDGGLYISTLIDPVFILLPIFDEARMKKGNDRGMFRELDEILFVNGYPGYRSLLSIADGSMQLICEVKEIGSSKFFRLDDSKVLAWLCHKVNSLKITLPTLDKNYAVREERDTLSEVVSLLGEYLKDPWLKLLCSHLHVDIQEALKKARNEETTLLIDSKNNLFSSSPLQLKNADGKCNTSNGKPSKKPKTIVDSQNIKDMFSRASRRRT